MAYYNLRIEQDYSPENPLLDCIYFGQVVIPYLNMEEGPWQEALPEQEIERLSRWVEGDPILWDILRTVCPNPTGKMEEIKGRILHRAASRHILTIPVYLYQHGGSSISTAPFNDPWDSGQCGYVYATKEQVIGEFGDFSEESRGKARNLLKESVGTLNQWLTGDVWGYVIQTREGAEAEVLDSCWGLYGRDWAEEAGQLVVDSLNSELQKENEYRNYLETVS